MVAFASPFYACKWAMMVQEELLVSDWPPGLLLHKDASVEIKDGILLLFEAHHHKEKTLWRGLKVRMGMVCILLWNLTVVAYGRSYLQKRSYHSQNGCK
jgi:hypothetical protein